MTSVEFKSWLKGFLEDKNCLTSEQVSFIKGHLGEINDTPQQNYPFYVNHPLTIDCSEKCINCEEHEYPDVWNATIPPHCKKCGKQAQSYDITFASPLTGEVTNGDVTLTNPQQGQVLKTKQCNGN